ncbi:hypothetical protein, partial [Saccharicrinis sp. FJH54]|uniref:hypothetical protein n=1 Tax=Saccharicrinis sp. FJH54 TaxID=3344665 RepID=UPI0035D4316E
MSRKTERRFLKILISVLSIPFLFLLITEIMTPDAYVCKLPQKLDSLKVDKIVLILNCNYEE